jgi:CDP-paratose 2-epimerase
LTAAKSGTKAILVTGSNGLIGSEVCLYFAARGFEVSGIDNNQRAAYFGPQGDTRWNQSRLQEAIRNFHHCEVDVRDRARIEQTVKDVCPSIIVHAAAQPSHGLAVSMPFEDFDTNAVGTLNMLEAARRHCPESPFVYLSTNKVYGDGPNTIRLKELETRWDYDDLRFVHGIPESFGVDQVLHSLFGASKLAADTLVQEYGRYFRMPTCCLRGGCMTGPGHSGVELHGFLIHDTSWC